VRRVPTEQVFDHAERLVGAYMGERQPNERFRDFTRRKSDEELISIASGRPLDEVIEEQRRRKVHRSREEEIEE
jgi:sulfite reductase beta subunit-like hemoprotein